MEMKFTTASILALLTFGSSSAFVVTKHQTRSFMALRQAVSSDATDMNDFYNQVTSEGSSLHNSKRSATLLTSAVMEETAAEIEGDEGTYYGDDGEEEGESLPVEDAKVFSEMEREMAMDDFRQQYGLTKRKKRAKIQREGPRQVSDYVWDFAVPTLGITFLASAAVSTVSKKYKEQQADTLGSYTNEMIYHDGDFEEMKMCQNIYRKKMGLGRKRKIMLTAFLEAYSKKKVVSPKAISSLSYVFSLYKLSEQDAAKILVKAAENLSTQPASRSKLLFFGEHILKSPEAQKELQPIRDMLASSYRSGGATIVANAQTTIGQAAYKSAVIAGGPDQTTLTLGWDLLGLTKEVAERIFDACKKDNFESDAKKLYGQPQQQYDDKGRKIDESGKPLEGEEDEDDSGADSPTGSVFECSDCGYTLFPAKGREFKFFPDSFTCPECGAPKSKFIGRN